MSRQAQMPRATECGDEEWHGTIGGYCNHSCSGPSCRAAWSAYQKVLRSKREGTLHADDERHGEDSTYANYKCKCKKCKSRHNELKRLTQAAQRQARESVSI